MDKDKVEKYLYEAPLKSATISFMRNTKTTEDKSSFVISVREKNQILHIPVLRKKSNDKFYFSKRWYSSINNIVASLLEKGEIFSSLLQEPHNPAMYRSVVSTRNPKTKSKLLQETGKNNTNFENDKIFKDIEQCEDRNKILDDSENDEEILDSVYCEVKYISKHLKNLEDNMKSQTYNYQKLRNEAKDSVENTLKLLERLRQLNFENNIELNDKQKRAKTSVRATLDRLYGLMEK